MTGTVIAIAGAKGGVGKTTTTVNLGSAAAMVNEWSVVTVELDLAMANFLDFIELEEQPYPEPTLHDVLAGSSSITDAAYEAPGGIDVVPSGLNLEGYASTDPAKIREGVATLREDYDLVLLDTAAGVSYETLLPLGLADTVILVSTPRLAAVRDAKKTRQLADQLNADVAGVIFTRSGTGNAPGVEKLAEFLGVDLLAHIPEDPAIPEAQDKGVPVLVHDLACPAAKAYWETASRIRQIVRDFKINGHADRSTTVEGSSSPIG